MVQRISASQFKARCLGLMDAVASTSEPLVITKNGAPVTELHPCSGARQASPFGLHPATELLGDVITPPSTGRMHPSTASTPAIQYGRPNVQQPPVLDLTDFKRDLSELTDRLGNAQDCL